MSQIEFDTVTRTVTVDRDKKPQEVLLVVSEGREQCIDWKIVGTIPRGEGIQRVTVEFFKPKPGHCIQDDAELARVFEELHLIPDPYAVMAVNKDDQTFSDEYPNCVIWEMVDNRLQDEDFDLTFGNTSYGEGEGRWGSILFDKNNQENGGKRCVTVGCVKSGYGQHLWFGGVRQNGASP